MALGDDDTVYPVYVPLFIVWLYQRGCLWVAANWRDAHYHRLAELVGVPTVSRVNTWITLSDLLLVDRVAPFGEVGGVFEEIKLLVERGNLSIDPGGDYFCPLDFDFSQIDEDMNYG